MYKLTYFNPENDQQFYKDTAYIDWALVPKGKFHINYMPRPFKEVSKEIFDQTINIYSPLYEGIGLIFNPVDYEDITGKSLDANSITYLETQYYFFAEKAFADVKLYDRSLGVLHKYYLLGCDHKWERIGGDKFENRCKCSKCGMKMSFQTGF